MTDSQTRPQDAVLTDSRIELPAAAAQALSRRIHLVTGKGGVGRSTWSAVLARQFASQGYRTLLAEITEPGQAYSPLARIWGQDDFGVEPKGLEASLDGVALSPRRGQELFLSRVIHVETLAKAALASEAIRKLLDVAPSFRELGVYYHLLTLLKLMHISGAERFERVVIDLPATGHTLALTGLPEILGRVITRGPIAESLREGQRILNSESLTAAWVIALPEPLPVTESFELIAGLKRTHVPVGGVILNRLRKDPFNPEERQVVEGWIREGRSIPGYRAAVEVGENRAALDRLLSLVKEPVVRAPDLEDIAREPKLVVSELVSRLIESVSRSAAGGAA